MKINAQHRIPVTVALLLLLSLIAFGSALRSPFLWDDYSLIVHNPFLGSPGGLAHFLSPEFWERSPFLHDFRPVEMYSYSLDHFFWEKNPIGYHVTNLLLHAFNCVAVFVLVSGVFRSARLAAIASSLFALHPVHCEAVIWAQNRSELLSAAFFLVGLLAFRRSLEKGKGSLPAFLLALLAAALAFFTKENTIVLPFFCVLLLAYRPKAPAARPFFRLASLFLLAAGLLCIRFTVAGGGGGGYPSAGGIATPNLPLAVKSVSIYLSMLILPANLSIDRVLDSPVRAEASALVFCAALILLLLAVTALQLRRRGRAGAALGFLFIALLPVSNIVYISGRPLAEQRLYIPSIGFCLLLALFIEACSRPGRRPRAAALLAVSICTTYLLAVIDYSDYWRDEQALWERTLERSPLSYRPRFYLARFYRKEGRYSDAIPLFKSILRDVSPRSHLVFFELGAIYKRMGRDDLALRQFERAVAAEPLSRKDRLFLGGAYLKEGRLDDARKQFEYIEKEWPWSGKGQLYLGTVYRRMGRYDDALGKFDETLAIFPGNERALLGIASIRSAQGMDEEAETLYREIIERNQGSFAARNEFGAYLSRRKRADEAIVQYERAAAADPENWKARYNLAGEYTARGNNPRALIEIMIAARLEPGRRDLLREVNLLSGKVKGGPPPRTLMDEILREHCRLLRALASHRARCGDESAAIEYYLKLTSLEPGDAKARANLGRTYASLGRYREAVKQMLLAVSLMPDEPSLYASLGSCYAGLGRFEEARQAWRRALEIDPRADEPRRNLARLGKHRGGPR